jgi:NADPH-dependent 2,4-dienoyl-CoA reductase/sulfur reductase-like enzyme
MIRSKCDVLIVGGGPSGLALAAQLRSKQALNVRVLERESSAGGVPRHSFHPGYGIRDLHRFMSGPNYAKYYSDIAERSGVQVSLNTSAWDWANEKTLVVSSPAGVEEISAEKIVLATGARERPRNARLVPGSRPKGIFTTGSLQQAVYLQKQAIGTKAVIIGSEHVSYSAIMTLKHANVKTIAMVEESHRTQSFHAVSTATRIFYKYKFYSDSKLVNISGKERVTAVTIKRNNSTFTVSCDTIVFTGNWIPDNELARRGAIICDAGTKSPVVNNNFETSRSDVYAIGNLLLPIKSADQCVVEIKKLRF